MTPKPTADRLRTAGFDLVPGEPAVPLAILRTPSDPADTTDGLGLTRLAMMLTVAYTGAGAIVYDTTSTRAFGTAAAVVGCTHRRLTPARLRKVTAAPGAGDGGLLAAYWPADLPTDALLAAARVLLAPGGVLATIVEPRRHASDVSALTGAAAEVGLTYLQHLVAVTGTVHDTAITAHPEQTRPRGAVHVPVHRDVHLFLNPAGGPS
ncbi:hypothetical protein [Catellatospora paridis]|uniref:hypothetical protein n=1 Tax=Catellatospora paridis TaxID=1617086 RepID=UPI0012D3FC31|nr:hypothetical protein [Catellatospora paridis]